MRGVGTVAEAVAKLLEGFRDPDSRHQYISATRVSFAKAASFNAAVLGDTRARKLLKLFERPPGFRHADHWHFQFAADHHLLQRGEDLLVG